MLKVKNYFEFVRFQKILVARGALLYFKIVIIRK